jgi:predicted amidohydrolase YtcJ
VFDAPAAVTALLIEGGRIAAAGSDADMRQRARGTTPFIDAAGGLITPGFNDAHVHIHNGARQLANLDLAGETSQDGILRLIAGFASANPGRQWICGRGWIYAAFPGGFPDRALLDSVVPDRPAAFESYDMHTIWVNSAALARLTITRDSTDPPGGHIVRDDAGEPTGILKETAMVLVDRVLPTLSPDAERDLLSKAHQLAAKHGLTSLQDASLPSMPFATFDRIRSEGHPALRVRLSRLLEPGQSMAALERQLGEYEEESFQYHGDPRVRGGVLKTFMDGVIESRTASMLAPYAGAEGGQPGALGEPRWEPGEFEAALLIADRRRWQVEAHAIGDRAIREALDAFETAARVNRPRDRRHRIEHIEAIDPADIPRFGQLGVVASMQPYHADPSKNLFEMWAKQIGPERAGHGWPWASIQRTGGRLAFGSDWPVVFLDPRLGLNMAVNRTTVEGEPRGGWIPNEGLTVAQAIKGYTSGSAYAEFADDQKGALRPGMLADLTVWDRDLLSIPSSEIVQAQVQATIVGGEILFQREAGKAPA